MVPVIEEEEARDVPLYTKVPLEVHEYLNFVKEQTGITKSDAVTLILEVARKSVTPEQLRDLFDNYTLLGRDGLNRTL